MWIETIPRFCYYLTYVELKSCNFCSNRAAWPQKKCRSDIISAWTKLLCNACAIRFRCGPWYPANSSEQCKPFRFTPRQNLPPKAGPFGNYFRKFSSSQSHDESRIHTQRSANKYRADFQPLQRCAKVSGWNWHFSLGLQVKIFERFLFMAGYAPSSQKINIERSHKYLALVVMRVEDFCMLSVITNMGSLWAQNAPEKSKKLSASGQPRLATGLKVYIAADDAAGASMSSKPMASITGTKRGIQNAADMREALGTWTLLMSR